MSFAFIHAADLHLDSPFQGVRAESPAVARALQEATFAAFARLIELAIARQVQFVLLAGDVYDAADRSLRAQLRFVAGLQELAAHGISCCVAHGNHDALEGWSAALQWPAGVHVFGPEPATVRIGPEGLPRAAVCGISYSQRHAREPLAARLRPDGSGLFQIALLHANCGGHPAHDVYAPCTVDELARAGFDYWALGHVHERAVLHEYPHVVYPGNPQGRHVRESGPRGCFVVEVDDRRGVRLEFCALDAVRWSTAAVSIEGCTTVDALQRAVTEAALRRQEAAAGRGCVCRVLLEGRGPLYAELAREGAVADLRAAVNEALAGREPFVWIEDVQLWCRPELDLARRQQQGDLLATALRLADEALRLPDAELVQRLQDDVLGDLLRLCRAEEVFDRLDPAELRWLLDRARWLCVELLESGA